MGLGGPLSYGKRIDEVLKKKAGCPSLVWLYPKKPELRNWLDDGSKLFAGKFVVVILFFLVS